VRTFHIAITGDFLDERGESAYGDLQLSALEKTGYVEWRFIRELSPRAGDSKFWQRLYSLEVTAEQLAGADGLIVLRPWVKGAVLADVADRLLVIGRSGAGYDKIDVAACTEHDLALFNAPLALNHATASAGLLFMLALAKRLPAQQQVLRRGQWQLQSQVMGSEIEGRTLGIVGLGHSGRELARLVTPFAMNVLAYSPHADANQARAAGVRLTTLDELLTTADFVSLHARLTAENHQLIGRRELALMKSTAYLINVARGELVDQGALVDALRSDQIAGAALDVFEHEPLAPNDPLLELENVIATPHWLASTKDVFAATSRAMRDGMLRAARGEVPQDIVNREVLDRPGFRSKLARFEENR
jgi:phosphoglycerate dehydrogenase-like enzyme